VGGLKLKDEKEIGKREKKSRRKSRNKFKTKSLKITPEVFQRALQNSLDFFVTIVITFSYYNKRRY